MTDDDARMLRTAAWGKQLVVTPEVAIELLLKAFRAADNIAADDARGIADPRWKAENRSWSQMIRGK